MTVAQKLEILADSAKYDVACTSSGADRSGVKGLGSALPAGCCHSFSADGRCVSLLKVLMTNSCMFDCKYCVNRRSNDVPRATFTPEELAELTIEFYRRNYIEGLFLSSGVIGSPDATTERMIKVLELLRFRHNFWGYIHAKAIPGTSGPLIDRLAFLCDRMSVNIELPSEQSLELLAPDKTKKNIFGPMGRIANGIGQNSTDLANYREGDRGLKYANAGQSTQMIVGASGESDYQIVKLSSAMYKKYSLKRVFFSAYIPVAEHTLLPSVDTKPPLLREHRLYQADFLMRQYNFEAEEILSETVPTLNPYLDPKCNWALENMHYFPVDVNTAGLHELLRVPGIGPTSARRIVSARKTGALRLDHLKKIGVVLKRARFFIRTADASTHTYSKQTVLKTLLDPSVFDMGAEQVSLFDLPAYLPSAPELIGTSASFEDMVRESLSVMAAR